MLFRSIFSVLHILPNNNTTTAPKKQEGSAKKWPVHRPQRSRPLSFMKKTPGQPCALAATSSLQMGRKPVQSKQNALPGPYAAGLFDRRLFYHENLSSVCPSYFRAGSGSAGPDRLLCGWKRRAGRQAARPAQDRKSVV